MITYKAKTPTGEIINSALSPFTFPAGETHIKREERRELEKIEIAIVQPSAESLHTDLFHLLAWSDYLYRADNDIRQVALVPYFPGARADRGAPFGAELYAQFLYSSPIDEVILFDPHSQVIVDQLNCDPDFFSIIPVYSDELLAKQIDSSEYAGVIAPDKGAIPRTTAISKAMKLPMYTARKVRNESTGKLSGFEVDELPAEGKFLVVDDICDGGGTFAGLAEASGLPKERLDLYVSHGVFSGNAYFTLSKNYGKVYSTNSYQSATDPPNVHFERGSSTIRKAATFQTLDVIRLLLSKVK